MDHLDRPTGGIDHLDAPGGVPGQLVLVAGLRPVGAHQVTGGVLEPELGRLRRAQLAELADQGPGQFVLPGPFARATYGQGLAAIGHDRGARALGPRALQVGPVGQRRMQRRR